MMLPTPEVLGFSSGPVSGCRRVLFLGCLLACAAGCGLTGVKLSLDPPGEPIAPPSESSPVAAISQRGVEQKGNVGRIDPFFEQGVNYKVMGSFSEGGRRYHAVCSDTEEPVWWFCLAINDDGTLKSGDSRFYLRSGPDGSRFKTLYEHPYPSIDSGGPLFRLVRPGEPGAAEAARVASRGDGSLDSSPGALPSPEEEIASAEDLAGCLAGADGREAIPGILRVLLRVRELKTQGVPYEIYVRAVAEANADITVVAMGLPNSCEDWLRRARWIADKYSLAGKLWSAQIQRRPLEKAEFETASRRHRELMPLARDWERNGYQSLLDALWTAAHERVTELASFVGAAEVAR
ncbi:MAG: hypothetical protein ACE5E4_08580 [Candidatus Binatia bacterium]